MTAFRGKAAFRWTDSDDQTTERVLLLREPVREIRPAHAQTVFVGDSLDHTNRQTFTVGEGADELVVRVRYQDDKQGMLDLIKAGSKGRTLTYVPDLNDADVGYACLLIAPLSPTALAMDADRGTSFGDLEVELRLRRTDETPFAGVWDKDTLFEYRAGGRLEEATFSRADVASYAAIGTGGSYGTLSTAASGAMRTHWMSTASTAGPRTFPVLLLEGARTNRVFPSENFASTLWTKATVSVTSGQADPRGGTGAFLVSDASTTVQGTLSRSMTMAATTRATASWFIRAGTTQAASGTALQLSSTSVVRIRLDVTWSSGRPVVTQNTGIHVATERWRGGWYRVAGRTTGNLSSGVTHVAFVIPAITAAQKGNVYCFGVQVEQ